MFISILLFIYHVSYNTKYNILCYISFLHNFLFILVDKNDVGLNISLTHLTLTKTKTGPTKKHKPTTPWVPVQSGNTCNLYLSLSLI